jgi:hypothetical protein
MTKKTTSTTKKLASVHKKASTAVRKTAAVARKARPPVKAHESQEINEQAIALLPPGLLDGVKQGIITLMDTFSEVSQTYLNKLQRRRKIGAGIRNYGFIEKVADLAEANPQFAQFFSPQDLRNCLINFDKLRDISLLLQSFTRQVTNSMLVYSDSAYGLSGIFYDMVKEMSRRGNPIAMELFRALLPFFKRAKRVTGTLTEKEALREEKALLRGKKDGIIGVENFSPKLTGGVHKIIDKKFDDTEKFSESEKG